MPAADRSGAKGPGRVRVFVGRNPNLSSVLVLAPLAAGLIWVWNRWDVALLENAGVQALLLLVGCALVIPLQVWGEGAVDRQGRPLRTGRSRPRPGQRPVRRGGRRQRRAPRGRR